MVAMANAMNNTRRVLLRRGIRLEAVVIAWNVIEGIVAVWAGLLASSVALIGFGIDSFIETSSAAVVLWRLRLELASEQRDIEAVERTASRIAGG